jgi:transposase InsO family protein
MFACRLATAITHSFAADASPDKFVGNVFQFWAQSMRRNRHHLLTTRHCWARHDVGLKISCGDSALFRCRYHSDHVVSKGFQSLEPSRCGRGPVHGGRGSPSIRPPSGTASRRFAPGRSSVLFQGDRSRNLHGYAECGGPLRPVFDRSDLPSEEKDVLFDTFRAWLANEGSVTNAAAPAVCSPEHCPAPSAPHRAAHRPVARGA